MHISAGIMARESVEEEKKREKKEKKERKDEKQGRKFVYLLVYLSPTRNSISRNRGGVGWGGGAVPR